MKTQLNISLYKASQTNPTHCFVLNNCYSRDSSAVRFVHADDRPLQAPPKPSADRCRLRRRHRGIGGEKRRRSDGSASAERTHFRDVVEPGPGLDGRCAVRHHVRAVDIAVENYALQSVVGAAHLNHASIDGANSRIIIHKQRVQKAHGGKWTIVALVTWVGLSAIGRKSEQGVFMD